MPRKQNDCIDIIVFSAFVVDVFLCKSFNEKDSFMNREQKKEQTAEFYVLQV